MLCTLVFVGYGHAWVIGQGTWLYKACYYDCGTTANSMWYDRIHRVDYNYSCPKLYRE